MAEPFSKFADRGDKMTQRHEKRRRAQKAARIKAGGKGIFRDLKIVQCRLNGSRGEREDSQITGGLRILILTWAYGCVLICLSVCHSVYLSVVQIPDSKPPVPSMVPSRNQHSVMIC